MDFPGKLEETLCSSPESGFGSEHQYSPNEQKAHVATPGTSTEEISIAVSDEVIKLKADNDKDDFSCLKIVNVQSLATSPPQEKALEKIPSTESLNENCTKRLEGTSRLFLHYRNNKKVLILDTSIANRKLDVTTDLNSTAHCIVDRNLSLSIPFSGLPIVSNRKNFKLTDSNKQNFVVSMLSRDDRRKYQTITSNHQRNLPLNVINDSPVTSTTYSFIPTPQKLNFALETCLPQKKVKPQSANVTSDNLHSDSTRVTTYMDIPGKQKLEVKPNILNNALVCDDSEFMVPVKQEFINSKSDRIKRLKALLQQKEKNLQEVRKNCGYIS